MWHHIISSMLQNLTVVLILLVISQLVLSYQLKSNIVIKSIRFSNKDDIISYKNKVLNSNVEYNTINERKSSCLCATEAEVEGGFDLGA